MGNQWNQDVVRRLCLAGMDPQLIYRMYVNLNRDVMLNKLVPTRAMPTGL